MTNTSTFIFQGWRIEKKEITFHYTLRHKEKEIHFTDTLILPKPFLLDKIPQQLLEIVLNNLLLMFGVSYWKLYCPKDIQIDSFTLTKEQAKFWNTIYTKGLGEFFYKNKIDFRGLVQFPYDQNKKTDKPVSFPRRDRSLLPVGGGKDSIVAAELLKKHHKPFDVVTFYTGLNNSLAQVRVSEIIGQGILSVKRMLDPQLFDLNKRKNTYNGHVPAVATYSFVSLLLAVVYDYRFIIFANEESANYGNVKYLEEMVNHQWSKSLEFEKMLQVYVREYITADIEYFSILRPFTEIQIAQLFSQCPQYFSSFVSCNKAYTMAKQGKTTWCGACPKCAFVFLLLSPYIPKERLVAIFGKNLFDDKYLLSLYEELLGKKSFKPFECVGTPEETQLALYYAFQKGEWKDTILMHYFVKYVLPELKNIPDMEKQFFLLAQQSFPKEFLALIER